MSFAAGTPFLIALLMASILMTPPHLLSTLILLEFISLLTLGVILTHVSPSNQLEMLTSLMIITLGASEASIGLSIMANMIQTHGKDKTSSLYLLSL